MKKISVQIHKDDACPICNEKFLKNDKELFKSVIKDESIGVVHDSCLMPYFDETKIKILYKIRCYSIGDTIASTPPLREIRRLYPRAIINVLTFFPDIFKYNPFVNGILDLNKQILQSTIDSHIFHIDSFDQEKGSHFASHSVEFSSHCALNRSMLPNDWHYDLFYSKDDHEQALKVSQELGIEPNDKVILIHPHKTEWSTRDWGAMHFKELAQKIRQAFPDFKLLSIGGKRSEVPSREMPNYIHIDGAIDAYGKLNLLQSAALMDLPFVKLLVTPDTGTLHLGATRRELPIVGIFTLIKSFFRTPVRNGKFSYKFIGVQSDDACSCTYTNRSITNEMNFGTCPKKAFLESTKAMKINDDLKINGLKELFREVEFKKETLNETIDEQIKKYTGSLPCFPSTDKVMLAIKELLK